MSINEGFNGDRIRKARVYRGWTVTELAEKMTCSRQTLFAYENKKTKPNDNETVEELSRILGFPATFFFQKEKNVSIGSTYFRALLTTNKKYRAEQIQKMEFVAQIYSFISEYINFMPPQMPIIPYNTTPEKAATILREQWGLGNRPIENIIHIVENNGILVTSFDTTTDDVDAFSQLVHIKNENGQESRFIIGYSNNKTSAARIHFDIAHELGHICLHEWDEDIEELDKDEFREREDEAHRFAAAFLLPASSFAQDAKKIHPTIPAYTQLKRKWKTSIAAMLRRSYHLGVITMQDYQNSMITMQKRGLRKAEPLDDTLLTASPALLKTAIHMLFAEKVFTPQTFIDELSYSHELSLLPNEVERLLDMYGVFRVVNIIPFPDLKIK
jgi:Zn-dependent peptidase ImmA (M78 family)/DNA-binding XRE family transcriptional regulator